MRQSRTEQLDKNKKERNYWLDNTKYFLIFMVVLGHFLGELNSNGKIKQMFIFIYFFHMPLFIFITGFFSKNVEKSRKRIITYFIVYVIMQSLILVIRKQRFCIVKPCFALWYLQAIIVYNLLLPIISKEKPPVAIILSVIAGLIIGYDNNAGEIGSLSRIFVMMPFFIIGYFTTETQLLKLKNKRNIIFGLVFLILLAINIPILMDKIDNITGLLQGKTSYYKMKMDEIGILYRAVWYIIATITSMSVLAIIPQKRILGISKFGTRTLQVYCLHIFVIIIFRQLNIFNEANSVREYLFLIFIAIILTPILSLKIFSYPFDLIMGKRQKICNKESKNENKEKNKAIIK